MKKTLLIIFVLGMFTSCNNSYINSQLPENLPVIDGKLEEWTGKIIIPENQTFGFGVLNDDSNLYISMKTYDKAVIMKVLNGLTVWIDEKGKKNQTFGIKYPLKIDKTGTQEMMDDGGKKRGSSEESEGQQEIMIQNRLSQQDGIIIVKNDIEQISDTDNGEDGIQVKMVYENDELFYEMKIPRAEFSLNETDKISIGIETDEMEKSDKSGVRGQGGGKSGGGKSGGGMGGKTKGAKGGMGSSQPGGNRGGQTKMEPIEVWTKIILAKE